MRIAGKGHETFLYVNGIIVERPIILSKHALLLPASCSPEPTDIIAVSKTETDLAIATLFLRSVSSQVRVTADAPENLAVTGWNTIWYLVLLSAFCHCDAVCNLQCDVPSEKFDAQSDLIVTNYHLRGFAKSHLIEDDEAKWIEGNVSRAYALLDKPAFQSAVHCLASYRWHSVPRVQLAVIWAGIEGLFGVDSEIVFRLSLYVARFLEEQDPEKCCELFNVVKRLYNQRSKAVHGAKIKGDLNEAVNESAQLLLRILKHCVYNNELPRTEILAP